MLIGHGCAILVDPSKLDRHFQKEDTYDDDAELYWLYLRQVAASTLDYAPGIPRGTNRSNCYHLLEVEDQQAKAARANALSEVVAVTDAERWDAVEPIGLIVAVKNYESVPLIGIEEDVERLCHVLTRSKAPRST
jgi:hypothetical protein